MRVLFIDGTWKDQVHEIDDNARTWNVPRPVEVNPSVVLAGGPVYASFETDTYTIHRLPMFGQTIHVAAKNYRTLMAEGALQYALLRVAVKELAA